MAGFGRFKVISIDYRMPPDHPYPAALDDAMTVWKAAVKTADPKNMAIFGSSAGGNLTLSDGASCEAGQTAAARSHRAGHANVRSHQRWRQFPDQCDARQCARCAFGANSDAARCSMPMAGISRTRCSRRSMATWTGFPPTILTTGTRDLLLSSTVRVHRKLRRAGSRGRAAGL